MIKRICDECKDYGIKKPLFEITPGNFFITFKAKFKYDYGSLDNQDITNQTNITKLTKEEQKMLLWLYNAQDKYIKLFL